MVILWLSYGYFIDGIYIIYRSGITIYYMEILAKKFKVIVSANSKRNEITSFDEAKNAYRVSIKARAEDNKANIELMKFLSKTTKKKARIVSGLRSREKIIELGD